MNALTALATLHDDEDVTAIQHPLMPTLYRDDLMAGTVGLMIPPNFINDDRFEVGRDCKECGGNGEISVTCRRCKGDGVIWGKTGFAEVCCDGRDTASCEDCNGTGTRWSGEE